MRGITAAIVLGVVVGVSAPALAQSREETLADIRQQLSIVYVDVQRLKRELSTTGAAPGVAAAGTPLQRIDAIEAELQRLTAKAEQLEYRINQVVTDGTNRIGDLEFRLCELEKGCDISQLGETSTLGGIAVTTPPSTPAQPVSTELAVSEQADFDRAAQALADGDYHGAANQFAAFAQTYPGGPLSGEAHYLRGEALAQLGQTTNAARAFLESFSGAPDGPRAPDALYQLGMQLAALGQTQEACVTLGEVGARFPSSAVVLDAQAARQSLGCS
ncbi:tol-pal system protein YbgF [Actibacterium sp. XHP0104]|uniref:tol-pal system protein YbgF n=1 Tax=Actibacterium sp. XHP0104 TaxID=2984335 RepID=UPI0021E814C7|nr:tol-pal system protein YbgF [Actibacterium sp. XHP0104]MCV2880499.1 tol-pal system protein YbgF [Actibacterium sp. XHP0104]